MTNKSRHDAIEFEIYHANLRWLNSQVMAIAYCALRNYYFCNKKTINMVSQTKIILSFAVILQNLHFNF